MTDPARRRERLFAAVALAARFALRAARSLVRATGVGLAWVLLTPAYLLLFVPGRLWLAWRRRDPLDRMARPDAPSRWVAREPDADPDRYRRPYA